MLILQETLNFVCRIHPSISVGACRFVCKLQVNVFDSRKINKPIEPRWCMWKTKIYSVLAAVRHTVALIFFLSTSHFTQLPFLHLHPPLPIHFFFSSCLLSRFSQHSSLCSFITWPSLFHLRLYLSASVFLLFQHAQPVKVILALETMLTMLCATAAGSK